MHIFLKGEDNKELQNLIMNDHYVLKFYF